MHFDSEILKWLNHVANDRFGSDFILKEVEEGLSLSVKNLDGEILFDNLDPAFLEPGKLQFYQTWYPTSEGFEPIIEDNLPMPHSRTINKKIVKKNNNGFQVHFDIFGYAYWLVNRLEEINPEHTDKHERFTAIQSDAYKNQYIDRPVVDEWFLILRQIITRQWPGFELLKNLGKIEISHDVDRPLRYSQNSLSLSLRAAVIDSFKSFNPRIFFMAMGIKMRARNILDTRDPYNTFEWLLNVSESLNLRSTFYFISGRTDLNLDASYDIQDKSIKKLLHKIYNRGHKIGLHPSYNTFKDIKALNKEFLNLKNILHAENMNNINICSRMHFLRWSHPETLVNLNDIGVVEDSTLGYAERAGFRCGSCYEYPGFDPVQKKLLKIKIKPLIVMDVSILSKKYMGFGLSSSGSSYIKKLKENCFSVGGNFTLLWHNSELSGHQAKSYYKNLLENLNNEK